MAIDRELQKRLRRRIDDLPVLPTVVGQLMVLDKDDVGYFDRLLELVESDPTFSARMLSAANSASSSPRSPVTSVRAALARLGSSGAASMILAAAVSRVFVPRDDWERSLWRHGLQVAGAMRVLAGVADEAHAAGLLHDIGRFVLLGEAPDTLRRIDEGQWDNPEELLDLERSICGMTHGDLGKMASDRWGLPGPLGEVVLRHDEPNVDATAGPTEAVLAILHFADLAMFPSAMPGAPGYASLGVDSVDQELPAGLRLSAGLLHEMIRTVTVEVDDTCRALGLA